MKTMIILSVLLLTGITSALAQHSSYVLTSTDTKTLYKSFQYALENSPSQQATHWVNLETGLTGSTIPLDVYRTSAGQSCRDYFTSLQVKGKANQAFGTACQQSSGYWKVVSEKLVGTYVKLVNSATVGANLCCNSGCSDPVHRQNSPVVVPTHRHYRNHIHGDKYQLDKPHRNQGMPQVNPPKQQFQAPSKLIRLVDYRTE